jgi:glycosyltransferase involved in cell wall biosynthesis
VVVPARNEAAHIGGCVRAVRAQEGAEALLAEVVVADHGSDDDTAARAEAAGARVAPCNGRTIASVRNGGAALTTGEVLAFLDADCLPAPGWLRAAEGAFADPGVVAAGSYPEAYPDGATWVQTTWSRLCRRTDPRPRPADWLPSANLLIRKDAFDAVGGFDEALETCEDSDIGYRLGRRGTVLYVPDCRVLHLREPRTLMEFFRKEVWHSRHNYTGALRHGIRWGELPSLAAPALFLIGVLLMGAAPWLGAGALPAGAVLVAGIPTAYTVRALPKADGAGTLLRFWGIYCVYFAARAWSIVAALAALPGRRKT